MHKLDRPGIFDSLSGTNRGASIGAYKDYGLIAVLPNLFSLGEEYSIIYVAGVHGPGTAAGLRMLADKKSFIDHPYGGIYEVNIDRFASFFEKIRQSPGRWETPAYRDKEYPPPPPRTARAFLSSPSGRTDRAQRNFDARLRSLLQNVCAKRGISLEIADPYTLPMPPWPDFWETILAYEKSCDFVLHDVTGCARGVMVELGFSFATRKQYFLVWNNKKCRVRHWKEMDMPSLLSVANVEQVDLSHPQAAREMLDEKIALRVGQGHTANDCAECQPIPKDPRSKGAFVYARSHQLSSFLDRCFQGERIRRITEEQSQQELRLCRICQVLRVADLAFIQLDDDDPDSFIVLGMAKAQKKKTLLLTLDRYNKNDFPWATDAIRFRIPDIDNQLGVPVSTFINH
jgi:nucleoside 2-deoxyribosyltransferase